LLYYRAAVCSFPGLGFALAVLAFPFYQNLKDYFKNRNLAAGLTTLLVAVVSSSFVNRPKFSLRLPSNNVALSTNLSTFIVANFYSLYFYVSTVKKFSVYLL